ncbi:MAG: ABC transporter substrate-binding protein [Anaerolineae bacterium]|nr:ABC transporter substrate-binding protein [Anaerolineae bacterium]
MTRYFIPKLMLTVTVFISLLSACAPATVLEPETPLQIKVGVIPFASNVIFQIAESEGYFEEQGLDVELVQFKSTNEFIPLLLDGQIDVAQPTLTAGFFNAIDRGGTIKIVLPATTIEEQECTDVAYFVRKSDYEAGTFAEPSDWIGAKLALSPAGAQSTSGYITDCFLQLGEVKLADVELVSVDLAAQQEALRTGQVDIVITAEPWVVRMKEDMDLALLIEAESVTPGFTISSVVYGAKLLNNADAGARFAAAYLKAARQYAQGATSRNVEIVAEFTGLDAALVKKMCPAVIPVDGQINLDYVIDYQNWLIEQKLLDNLIAPDKFIDTSVAENARGILEKVDQ